MSFTAVISANIKDFESNLQKAQSQMDAFDKKIGVSVASIGRAVEGVGKKMSILSAGLVLAGGKAFQMAADFQDAIGATDQIFNDASSTVNEWAKNLSSDFGIAKEEALKYSNLMGSMLINIGQLTEEQAAKQSAKLIELAGDLTAMYGGTTQDAVRALTGALKGNNTMLDNYGMAVNDALVKQKAFELGLSSGTGELSLQAKQAATLALIWEQTGSAQGQAGREADTASGSMRALSVEVKNLATEIGEVLLPIITPIIARIKEFVSGLRELSPEMLRVGVVVAGVVASLGPLLIMIGKVLQMLPLIKVAIAGLTGPIGLAIGVATAGIIAIIKNWDMLKNSVVKDIEFIKNQFATTSNFITELLKGDFKGAWDEIKIGFNDTIDYFKRRWSEIKEFFGGGDKIEVIDQQALEDALKANEVTGSLGANVKVLTDNIKELTPATEDTRTAFEKLVEGMTAREAVQATTLAIEDLQSKIVKLQTGILPTSNLAGDLTEANKQLGELTAGLDLLTGGREISLDLKVNLKGFEGKQYELFGGKEGAAEKLKENLKEQVYAATTEIEQFTGQAIQLGQAFNDAITYSFSDGIQTLIDGMMSIEGVNANAVIGSLLAPFGTLAIQLGEIAIAAGIGIEAIKKTFETMNPVAAIAAGVGLIALGSLIKGAVKNLGSTMGSTATGGTASYRTTSPQLGQSDYRGMYTDNWAGNVTFKIGNNELVGVLEQANKRNNRI